MKTPPKTVTTKRGYLLINKSKVINHCKELHKFINSIDEIMKEKESVDRGKKIAKAINDINYELHVFEHFQLHVSLNKLGNKYPE